MILSDNSFFKPTLLYKEFMILDLIEKDPHITQREIASQIGVAFRWLISILDEYEKEKGLSKRNKTSHSAVSILSQKRD